MRGIHLLPEKPRCISELLTVFRAFESVLSASLDSFLHERHITNLIGINADKPQTIARYVVDELIAHNETLDIFRGSRFTPDKLCVIFTLNDEMSSVCGSVSSHHGRGIAANRFVCGNRYILVRAFMKIEIDIADGLDSLRCVEPAFFRRVCAEADNDNVNMSHFAFVGKLIFPHERLIRKIDFYVPSSAKILEDIADLLALND